MTNLKGNLYKISSDEQLKVSEFLPNSTKNTSDVAICLSGGGSRAMSAAMGQLRALKYLTTSNGKNLIEQSRLMSTVSGGSWLGSTFSYLQNSSVTDDQFLNKFVNDQGNLTPNATSPGQDESEILSKLPQGNIGNSISSSSFSAVELAVKALFLHSFKKVPTNMVWQVLVGIHILQPYELFDPTKHYSSAKFFSYDQETAQQIMSENPSLNEDDIHQVTSADQNHTTRPFLVCNSSMFVTVNGKSNLAPLQATPFFTGIVSSPANAKDINNLQVGGGGATSVIFDSKPLTSDSNTATVSQNNPWSLMDIIGTSSAFFAQFLHSSIKDLHKNDQLHDAIHEHGGKAASWIDHHYKDDDSIKSRLSHFLKDGKDKVKDIDSAKKIAEKVGPSVAAFSGLPNIVPQYQYWSPKAVPDGQELKLSDFADGGNLENIGIASALSYNDISKVIAFVNAPSGLSAAKNGVLAKDGSLLPDSSFKIDDQVPVLFGYQPYQDGIGYKLYEGDANPKSPQFANNQIFPSADFVTVLQGLWASSQSGNNASYKQELVTVENNWFGIVAGRTINVVWQYLNYSKNWHSELNSDTQKLVDGIKNFPNYPTVNTDLSAQEINLLANFTAWSAVNNKDDLTSLF